MDSIPWAEIVTIISAGVGAALGKCVDKQVVKDMIAAAFKRHKKELHSNDGRKP